MENDIQPIIVTTTSDDRENLLSLAHVLVEKRIAGCAQVTSAPITSVYHWDGKIEASDEVVLTIKTSKRLFAVVEQTICEHHNYEVPQIVAVEVINISEQYRAWLQGALDG